MTIQVNSDKTITLDDALIRFAKDEVTKVLGPLAKKLTRVEIHLSDIDSGKSGGADKRCVVEARPAGGRPLSVSANATKVAAALVQGLRKMQRALTTHFGKLGREAVEMAATPPAPKKKAAAKTTVAKTTVAKKVVAKKAVAVKTKAKQAAAAPSEPLPAGSAPKKRIYQARRKSWPAR